MRELLKLIGKARVKTQVAKIKPKINQDRMETLLCLERKETLSKENFRKFASNKMFVLESPGSSTKSHNEKKIVRNQ